MYWSMCAVQNILGESENALRNYSTHLDLDLLVI